MGFSIFPVEASLYGNRVTVVPTPVTAKPNPTDVYRLQLCRWMVPLSNMLLINSNDPSTRCYNLIDLDHKLHNIKYSYLAGVKHIFSSQISYTFISIYIMHRVY